ATSAIAESRSSIVIVVRKPRRPRFTPRSGMPSGDIARAARSMVPSPPRMQAIVAPFAPAPALGVSRLTSTTSWLAFRMRAAAAHDAARLDGFASGLELRLHERDDRAAVAEMSEGRRQREPQRDEREIGHDEVDRLRQLEALAGVDSFHDPHARVAP